MKISVAGIGYVGLSNAILLSQNNDVVAFDISQNRVDQLNQKSSPISDPEIEDYLLNKKLNLSFTVDKNDYSIKEIRVDEIVKISKELLEVNL